MEEQKAIIKLMLLIKFNCLPGLIGNAINMSGVLVIKSQTRAWPLIGYAPM